LFGWSQTFVSTCQYLKGLLLTWIYLEKLLGQKMVNEIDYFVPMPSNFFDEEFCNIPMLVVLQKWFTTISKIQRCDTHFEPWPKMLYVLNRCPRFILVPLDHRQDSSLENLAYYSGISPHLEQCWEKHMHW
jgi:hypothetical protein